MVKKLSKIDFGKKKEYVGQKNWDFVTQKKMVDRKNVGQKSKLL